MSSIKRHFKHTNIIRFFWDVPYLKIVQSTSMNVHRLVNKRNLGLTAYKKIAR